MDTELSPSNPVLIDTISFPHDFAGTADGRDDYVRQMEDLTRRWRPVLVGAALGKHLFQIVVDDQSHTFRGHLFIDLMVLTDEQVNALYAVRPLISIHTEIQVRAVMKDPTHVIRLHPMIEYDLRVSTLVRAALSFRVNVEQFIMPWLRFKCGKDPAALIAHCLGGKAFVDRI
jgi:hypothetical protein